MLDGAGLFGYGYDARIVVRLGCSAGRRITINETGVVTDKRKMVLKKFQGGAK